MDPISLTGPANRYVEGWLLWHVLRAQQSGFRQVKVHEQDYTNLLSLFAADDKYALNASGNPEHDGVEFVQASSDPVYKN